MCISAVYGSPKAACSSSGTGDVDRSQILSSICSFLSRAALWYLLIRTAHCLEHTWEQCAESPHIILTSFNTHAHSHCDPISTGAVFLSALSPQAVYPAISRSTDEMKSQSQILSPLHRWSLSEQGEIRGVFHRAGFLSKLPRRRIDWSKDTLAALLLNILDFWV